MIKSWFKSGSPWIWLNAAAVSTCLIMVVGVLGLIVARGVGHFWASPIVELSYQEDNGEIKTIIGEHVDSTVTPAAMAKATGFKLSDNEDVLVQYLIKTGNRDLTGTDFRWIQERHIKAQSQPLEMMVIERREWGNFYGTLTAIKENGVVIAAGEQAWSILDARLAHTLALHEKIAHIEKKEIGAINYALEKLRLKQRSLELKNAWNEQKAKEFADKKAVYDADYKNHQVELAQLYQDIRRDSLVATTESGAELAIPLSKIVDIYQPNKMGIFSKITHYFVKLGEFLSEDPREANTEGGIFPAIFGTVMMVMMMSVIVTPFGVIAAVYLREYAKQGFITRLIRIAVNNLAGVPSIVYGVFGLGFFVYILGGNIDALFFPEASPAPVFGTPGLLWASITLALLTLPVVIVSTEEGLARVPRAIREGSLALGATKIETLWRTVLPMASPAMMTGLILAVARAAGEVAPLMLVGVVKLAPTLPLDGNYPFLHLDRKFMHLGFHIYDVGFQSPNVEAARPLVYATALLLVLVIIGLNLAAIIIRNHLREKYRALEG
ncbi:MAG: phosphate transport system permease protein [Pseudomonadota bacterium]|nr:phosphate transport system permease protein [Pseudomonadota bacterium]